jgi:hypothetical protein
MTMLAPRSPQGYLAATVIKRELVLDLRHKRGLSYSPVVAYERLDRESAEVLVGCDALPENRAAVTTAMLETLDRLADDIPQEAIQEAVGDLAKIAADDRDAQVAELADQAMACLEQRPFVSRATVVEQLRQLASRELGQVVKGLRSTELLRIPLGVPAPAGFSLYPEGSQKVLAGKRVKSSKGKEHLVLSQRGLTFIEADEKTHTIEYEDCVAVLVWPNGTQSLIARDGSWIRLKTAAWSQPELIRAEIRAHVPPEKIVPMREDLPAKPPQDSCSQCGSEPAIKVHFMTVTGLVLLLRYRHHKGVVCRECGIEAFRRLTNQTLLAGWWGFFAWIMNLAALTRNFIERWRLARLAPPDKSKGYRPANPGRPLWQRNGMLATLLFVALVIAFVTVSSRP